MTHDDWSYALPTIGFLLAVGHFYALASARWQRELPALSTHPWRPVEAAVLRGPGLRPALVELTEGGASRVVAVRLGPGHAHVIRRTGRAWTVTRGTTTLLRVDGSHGVAGGRPAVPGPTRLDAPVDGDRFTAALLEARRLRSSILRPLLLMVLAWAVFAFFARFGLIDRYVVQGAVFGSVLGLAAAFPQLRVVLPPDLGEWTWVSATLDPWTARADRTTAKGWVSLADGRHLRVSLLSTTPDFLGTVWEAGGFWVAGQPEPGRTYTAGFPDAPVAAAVRFSSVRK
ncbi:hypothetical protein ACFQV2_09295 [Actinokineospora soli]|uniref:Uncharacterized protein n=1 Tax=Actinokineospora soli TaxID=1048753 RepID=A0ABW2TKS5_9PSEU